MLTSIVPHCTTQLFCNPLATLASYSAQVSPFSLPLGSPQQLRLGRGLGHRGVCLGVGVRVLHPAPALHQLWERQTGEPCQARQTTSRCILWKQMCRNPIPASSLWVRQRSLSIMSRTRRLWRSRRMSSSERECSLSPTAGTTAATAAAVTTAGTTAATAVTPGAGGGNPTGRAKM